MTNPFFAQLYEINPLDGSVTLIGSTANKVTSLALDPLTGIMYAGTGGGSADLNTVDTSNAELTVIGNTGDQGIIVGLDFRADGTLFAAVKPEGTGDETGGTHLGTVDTANADITFLGAFGFNQINSIAFFGNTLYGVSYDGNLYQIDTSSGAASLVATIGDGSIQFGASQFACDGTYYAGQGQGADSFGTIDIATGAYNEIASGIFDGTMGGMAFSDTCPSQDPSPVIGGEILPIDSATLLIAGIQSSTIWMLPALTGIAGAGAYYIRTRMNKDN